MAFLKKEHRIYSKIIGKNWYVMQLVMRHNFILVDTDTTTKNRNTIKVTLVISTSFEICTWCFKTAIIIAIFWTTNLQGAYKKRSLR